MKKRVLAIFLALALCFGTAVPAFATTEDAEEDIALTNTEMIAKLPSQAPEVIKPENTDQLKYGGFCDWTGTESDAETVFQEIIEQTERLTSGSKTETEKARAIFNWVASNISYAYLISGIPGIPDLLIPDRNGFTATDLGTFYYRRGVCEGYARLANLMLTLAGLPSAFISGTSANEGHAWSAVYADGRWILFDATWNEWDISPDFHESIEYINWTSGVLLVTISMTGGISCKTLYGYNCPSKVIIPDSVTSIGDFAFNHCTGLTSVVIPDSVTSIGDWAFHDCTGLTSVTIPSSVTDIGDTTFKGCTSLTSVVIPDGVTSIRDSAFRDCTSLTNVTIPSSVTSIESYAFEGCESLTSVTIPDSVTSIGWWAFGGCTSLTSVVIPDGVTSIRDSAFRDCTSLTSVTIPDSVTSIGDYAFQDCSSLISVTFQEGITNIGIENAFDGCTNLTSVFIPSSVTEIVLSAFYGCKIYYGGSETQWKTVRGGTNTVYYDGTVSYNINDDVLYMFEVTTYYNSHPIMMKFTDLSPTGFYLDAVAWAVEKNITTGTTATSFAPKDNCTHGQILTFLWRAAGEPESSAQPPIAMKGNEFYYKAVKWAAEKGMIGANFNPKADCTRAYAVQYIWQAMGKPAPSKDSPFTDIPAHWSSATAAAWAAEKGITTGTTATAFSPNKICNRGEIVTFLYRAYNE